MERKKKKDVVMGVSVYIEMVLGGEEYRLVKGWGDITIFVGDTASHFKGRRPCD